MTDTEKLPTIKKMKYPSCKVKEFQVPEFEMEPGKMIRFWVKIVPEKEKNTDEYWGVKRIFEIIDKYNSENDIEKIYLCPIKPKLGLIDFIKPIKVREYLKTTFRIKSKGIENVLETFDIKPEYIIRKMGFAHQKLFSIVCGIEKNERTAFDFYGLAPDSEIKLMKYINTKLVDGKSLIGFDNLGYKDENIDNSKIENLIIKRE